MISQLLIHQIVEAKQQFYTLYNIQSNINLLTCDIVESLDFRFGERHLKGRSKIT